MDSKKLKRVRLVIQMKMYIILVIMLAAVYLGFKVNIERNSLHKQISEELLLYIIVLCSAFNLVLLKLNIGSFNIEIGILSVIFLIYLYIFFIMYKENYNKDKSKIKSQVMLICLTLINIYIFLEPRFVYIYSVESYSLYLFTYFNIELMLIMFLILRRSNYEKKIIINVISVFSLINAFLGFMQYITGKFLINFKDPNQLLTQLSIGRRISGFVVGDNGGGNLGAILLPVLLYKYKKDKGMVSLILILADILFTIFTFTRIAYFAVFVELAVFYLLSFKISSIEDIIKKITALILVLCSGIYFYINYFNKIMNIFFLQRGDTQNDRFTQFPIAIKAFFSTPVLGTGHGQYNDYVMYKFGIVDNLEIHAQLLNILTEDGMITFILFSVFNIYLICMLLRKYNEKVEQIFIIILFIGNLICINFKPNQTYELNIYIYYFILFGLMFSKDEIQNHEL
jgi:hypothetical protein